MQVSRLGSGASVFFFCLGVGEGGRAFGFEGLGFRVLRVLRVLGL